MSKGQVWFSWIAPIAVGWTASHFYGWGGIGLVVAAILVGYIDGHSQAIKDVRDSGYAVKYVKGEDGKRRWRVTTPIKMTTSTPPFLSVDAHTGLTNSEAINAIDRWLATGSRKNGNGRGHP